MKRTVAILRHQLLKAKSNHVLPERLFLSPQVWTGIGSHNLTFSTDTINHHFVYFPIASKIWHITMRLNSDQKGRISLYLFLMFVTFGMVVDCQPGSPRHYPDPAHHVRCSAHQQHVPRRWIATTLPGETELYMAILCSQFDSSALSHIPETHVCFNDHSPGMLLTWLHSRCEDC